MEENSISYGVIKTKPIEKAMAINTVAMESLIELRLMNASKQQTVRNHHTPHSIRPQ